MFLSFNGTQVVSEVFHLHQVQFLGNRPLEKQVKWLQISHYAIRCVYIHTGCILSTFCSETIHHRYHGQF
jgi:hypothetical protein